MMIQTPTKRIIDAKWSIFHGKVVTVISPCYMIIDGQEQYNCFCEDGSGGGMLPEDILKPINKMENIEQKMKDAALKHVFDSEDNIFTAFQHGAKWALSNQWRSIEDELPPTDDDVVVAFESFRGEMSMGIAAYMDCKWYSSDDTVIENKNNIKYWMPLPPLPETITKKL